MYEKRFRHSVDLDMVVLVDSTAKMIGCWDVVRKFSNQLLQDLVMQDLVISDWNWRIKFCGYRSHPWDGADWFIDNPFVWDTESALVQLAGLVPSAASVKEPSLLDALFKIADLNTSSPLQPAITMHGPASDSIVATIPATFGRNHMEKWGEDFQKFMSSQQFRLIKNSDSKWMIENCMEAKNATNVDGEIIQEPQVVREGMLLTLGKTKKCPIRLSLIQHPSSESPQMWRSGAKKLIFFLTESNFDTRISIPEAKLKGFRDLNDVKCALSKGIFFLTGVCPESDDYFVLGSLGGAQFYFHAKLNDANPHFNVMERFKDNLEKESDRAIDIELA